MSEPTISEYFRKKQLIEQLSRELQALEESEAVRRRVAIEADIQAMLDTYDLSPNELVESVRALYNMELDSADGVAGGTSQSEGKVVTGEGKAAQDQKAISTDAGSSQADSPASAKPQPGKPVTRRRVKVYTNPNTGETVRTRGSNHRTLNLWRQRYGHDLVDSWWVYEEA